MLNTIRPRLLLLALGLIFIGTGIGLKDPWPSDEPRFALVAKEMVASGQWLFPTRGGELYPDKPPVFMWSEAVVLALTDSIRLANALPSLLAGLLVLLLVYDAGRRYWSPRVGLLAGLLLLVAPQFVLESRAGQLDAMVMAWIALGLYGFLRHLLEGPDRGWLWLGFAACGLGIITKGVGFLPLLVFIPWLFLRPRPSPFGALVNTRDAAVGVTILLGAIALWLVPMLLAVEASGDPAFEAYRDNILFKQTGERYVSPSHHFKPWWYFPGEVIPSLWLPVFLLLPWLIPGWVRAIRGGDRRIALLLAWVALVVTFFSLSPAKRGVYILPALPWICLAAAPQLEALFARAGVRRLAYGAAGMLGVVALGAAVYATLIAPDKTADIISQYHFDPRPALWAMAVGCVLATGVAVWRRQPGLAFPANMLVLWVVMGLLIYPGVDAYKSGRTLMERVEASLGPDQPLALVDWKEQNLLQAQRPTINFGFLVPVEQQVAAAIVWLDENPAGRALVQGSAMSPCFDELQSESMGLSSRRSWFLVSSDSVVATCRDTDS